ncbi:MAG: RHS repeat-associated core domain-containing protein [Cyclobacteriaceae bacterium]|nr:RHS repeat-associated core domain-containing protein [Cyclobacteriaceae bacterium]
MGLGLGQQPVDDALAIGDERYTYDKIGNIKQLSRTVRHSDPMNTAVVSKAEGWNYYYNGFNKLTQVTGHPGTQGRAYTYDKNGNLLTDSYREIAATEYGRTAYPYYLEADNKEIYYLYSVDDHRTYKKVVSPTETTTEFYLLDATGKTVALRRKVGSAAATWEYYVNGSVREARIKNVTHNGMIAAQEIEFYLYDHLGNTRVVYEPTYAGGALELAINYAADYFPYGKVLREYVNTSTGDPEKFLTTQHERDKETGLDYRGARFYDSDIARFLSLDPLAKEFPAWSAYNYVMGNPISLIDPDGKVARPPDWYENEYGQRKYFEGETRDAFWVGHGMFSGGTLTNLGDVKWSKVNDMGPTNDAYFASGDFNFNKETELFNTSKRLSDIGGGIFDALKTAVRPTEDMWLGKNGKYYNSSWGGNGHTGGRSVASKAANHFKWGARGTVAASAIIGGIEVYDGYQTDGKQFGYHAQSAAAQTLGSIGGGAAGSVLGAKIGAGIGLWFGGVGAVPGAIIGGFVGGLLGGEVGGSIGKGAVDMYHDK